MVVLGEGAVSYERGTPVGFRVSVFGLWFSVFGFEERRPRNEPEALTRPDAVRLLGKVWMEEGGGMNVLVVRDGGSGAE